MAPPRRHGRGAIVAVPTQTVRTAGWEEAHMQRWRALAIAPLAALLVTGPVLAQEGTPESEGAENPRLVAPSECVAEPRAYDDIATILALDGEGVPPPAMTQITPPLGDIADVKTSISIKEAARQVLACFNASDIPRAAGL